MAVYEERDAETVQGCVLKIVRALGDGDEAKGWEPAAKVVGLTADSIRAWANPKRGIEPKLEYMIMLDSAYHQKTMDEPPLWRLHAEMISKATAGSFGIHKYDLHNEMLGLHHDVAAMTMSIQAAQHPDSPGGPAVVPIEEAEVSQKKDRVADRLARVMKALRQIANTASHMGRAA